MTWLFKISLDEGQTIISVEAPTDNLAEAERYVSSLYPSGILVSRDKIGNSFAENFFDD